MTSRIDGSERSVTMKICSASESRNVMLARHMARQIDHDGREIIAQLLNVRWASAAGSGVTNLCQRGFGTQDRELVAFLHHRALDEQSVDAAWIFQRVAQAAARLEIESERRRAVMDVEIQKPDLALEFMGH